MSSLLLAAVGGFAVLVALAAVQPSVPWAQPFYEVPAASIDDGPRAAAPPRAGPRDTPPPDDPPPAQPPAPDPAPAPSPPSPTEPRRLTAHIRGDSLEPAVMDGPSGTVLVLVNDAKGPRYVVVLAPDGSTEVLRQRLEPRQRTEVVLALEGSFVVMINGDDAGRVDIR